MSKKNGKGPEIESVEAYQEERLSSGVVVTVLPFPARLHENIQAKALEKFPEPVPPKKVIKVAGPPGQNTETTDDINNPQYLEEKENNKALRDNWVGQKIGEKVIDFCIQVDISPYEHVLKKLAEIDDIPEDLDEKRIYFLQNYAMRGRADYERVMATSITLMAVGDREITQRMQNFRNQMEGTAFNNPEAPSSNASIRVDLGNKKA